jgi:hypothetical protein
MHTDLSYISTISPRDQMWEFLIGAHEAGWAGHLDVFTCLHLRRPYRSEP